MITEAFICKKKKFNFRIVSIILRSFNLGSYWHVAKNLNWIFTEDGRSYQFKVYSDLIYYQNSAILRFPLVGLKCHVWCYLTNTSRLLKGSSPGFLSFSDASLLWVRIELQQIILHHTRFRISSFIPFCYYHYINIIDINNLSASSA